jgi:hypothetical protein
MGEAHFRHLKGIRAWFGHLWEWVEEYHPIQRRAEDDEDDEDDDDDNEDDEGNESDDGNQDHDDGGNNDGNGEGGGGWSKMPTRGIPGTEEIAIMTGIAL